jgi:ACS family hexuronate transporter-like MFS transporter
MLIPNQPGNGTSNGSPAGISPSGRLRWIICGMLFLATVINYVDRFALSFLAKPLQEQFKWSDSEFGWILFAFQASYASMNVVWGSIIDRIGLRLGYALGVIWWSIAAMGHAFARSVTGFGFWRVQLGIGEAVNWPGAIKTIAEWFPQRERAMATGLFNGGANIGAMIAPPILAVIVAWKGWEAAFLVTGAVGFVWAVGWWFIYGPVSRHTRLSAGERAWITQDGPVHETTPRIPWRQLIGERRAWAFILGKAFSDPVWSFFLFWFPKFLGDVHHLNTAQMASVVWIPYLAADFGSIGGGWLSSHLIQRGWSINRARKTALLATACSVPFVVIAGFTDQLWLVLVLVSVALAMHQWWSANLFTITSDMFPTQAVGTVVGMGQVGGSGMAMLV